MKILEICKKYGMGVPNDIRHWIEEIDQCFIEDVGMEVEKWKNVNAKIRVKCWMNHVDQDVNTLRKNLRDQTLQQVKRWILESYGKGDRSSYLVDQLHELRSQEEVFEDMVGIMLKCGGSIERNDVLESGDLSYQVVSKKLRKAKDGILEWEIGLIKF